MRRLRRLLLSVLPPVVWFITYPARRRRERLKRFVAGVEAAAACGDVILTRRRFSLTGLLIPGRYSHAALRILAGGVVHAVYPTVRTDSVTALLRRQSEAVVLRPVFANSRQAETAVSWALLRVGRPYDLGFGPGKDAFYCSELVWRAYAEACEGWKFEARRRMGVETVTPQDLHDATDHFRVVARVHR